MLNKKKKNTHENSNEYCETCKNKEIQQYSPPFMNSKRAPKLSNNGIEKRQEYYTRTQSYCLSALLSAVRIHVLTCNLIY